MVQKVLVPIFKILAQKGYNFLPQTPSLAARPQNFQSLVQSMAIFILI